MKCIRQKPQLCLVNVDPSLSVEGAPAAIPMQEDHFSFVSDFAPSLPPAFGDSTTSANDEGDNFILSSEADDSLTWKDDKKLVFWRMHMHSK